MYTWNTLGSQQDAGSYVKMLNKYGEEKLY